MKWQLNKIQYPVYNLGQGKRIGIWVQGCTLGCKGCVNQILWKKKGGNNIPLVDIFNWILTLSHDYDGITISGGEPFQQYEQLIAFMHLIKSRTKLNIQCFTGYYLSELNELFPDKLFMKYIDILIDGRYIEKENDSTNIKGSANQTTYIISEEKALVKNHEEISNKWSLKVSENNQIYMVGIPKKNELHFISDHLTKVGIQKRFK